MTDLPALAIAGAAGRMGRELLTGAAARGFAVTGATEAPDSEAVGLSLSALSMEAPSGVSVVTDPVAAAAEARVWIDFTSPAATLVALEALRHTPVSGVVIGTTGFSETELEAIERAADNFAIVKAGNFSLGVAMLCALVETAAARLGPEWDIEVQETHHRRKVDAPSGTALMVGEAAAKGRGAPLETLKAAPYDGPDAPREEGRIGFSVRRAGGVVGEHEALFGSEKELLKLSHTALDRAVFVDGALQAAQWVSGKAPGLYSMTDVLDL